MKIETNVYRAEIFILGHDQALAFLESDEELVEINAI
jgi:hypothetical protein